MKMIALSILSWLFRGLFFLLFQKYFTQAFIENGALASYASIWIQYKWCKRAVLDFEYTFIVVSFLLFFIPFLAFSKLLYLSSWKVKYPYVKKFSLTRSSLAFLRIFAVISLMSSPSISASIGSILTSVQTSFKRFAVLLLTSLWRRVTNCFWRSHLFNRQCVRDIELQTTHTGNLSSAQRYLLIWLRRGILFWLNQIHGPSMAGLSPSCNNPEQTQAENTVPLTTRGILYAFRGLTSKSLATHSLSMQLFRRRECRNISNELLPGKVNKCWLEWVTACPKSRCFNLHQI